MEKDKIIKGIVSVIGIIVIVFGINICIAAKRIEKYSCLTPLENLTFTERIAAKLYDSSFQSKAELQSKNLLQSDETIKRDNAENLQEANKKEKIINSNYTKAELEFMYDKSEKYIGKELDCIATISMIGLNEESKQSIIKIVGKEKFEEMPMDVIVARINDTDVSVTMMYDKEKINYDHWRKGTVLKIKGTIVKVEGDSRRVDINIKDNPDINIIE